MAFKNPTFGATPFDGGYPNPSLHDSVELGLDVKLWVFRLNALKLYGHWKKYQQY